MIVALQERGHVLRLVGETVSVEVTQTTWCFKLYGEWSLDTIFSRAQTDKLM